MTRSQRSSVIGKGDQALLQVAFEGVPFVGAPSGSVTSLLSSTVALSLCTVQLDVWSRRVRESNMRHDGALEERSMLLVGVGYV